MARHRFPVEQFGPRGTVVGVTVRIGLTKGSRRPPLEILDEVLAATTRSAFEGFFGTILGVCTFTTGAVLVAPLAVEAFFVFVVLEAGLTPAAVEPCLVDPVTGLPCLPE